MFVSFFYHLREAGIPVSPTAFLTFQRALAEGLVNTVGDFYRAARTIMVKNEKHFDRYDRVFAAYFGEGRLEPPDDDEPDRWARALLDEWLRDPVRTAAALGIETERLASLSIAELLDYFKERLAEQDGRHDGGSRWIGTGGTSPVGHGGAHPSGLRIGGRSRHKSAIQVAAERRFREYGGEGPLTGATMAEALKRLRHMVPRGAKKRLDVDASIYQTVKQGGEVEIVFKRAVVDRLKVILAIDNGGWSMDPHVPLVRSLFSYATAQFKRLQIYYFHNTIYDLLWEDPGRYRRPVRLEALGHADPDTRLIIVGDASMAPYELMVSDGSIHAFERSGEPSLERLRFLAGLFRHHVWLNPVPRSSWRQFRTIGMISTIFPMHELSLDGLEQAVTRLMRP